MRAFQRTSLLFINLATAACAHAQTPTQTLAVSDLPTEAQTAAPPPTPPPSATIAPSPTPVPEPAFPSLVWLPYASGAHQGDVLVVRDGVPAREPVPETILIELFWDYDSSSGRLAYAGQFWHAAQGTNKSVSDLRIYDYRTDSETQWLSDDVARAIWSPVPDPNTGEAQLAVFARNPETGIFSLMLVAEFGQLHVLAEYASPRFSWSPDGTQIVFVRDGGYGLPPDGNTGIFVVDVAAGTLRRISDDVDTAGGWIGDQPVWVPDRNALILPHSPALVVPLDGSGVIYPELPRDVAYDGGRPYGMLWSEASGQLLVHTDTLEHGSQVWAVQFSDDLRAITGARELAPGEQVGLVGWLAPGEVVLLAARGGYGEPIAWSLSAGAVVGD